MRRLAGGHQCCLTIKFSEHIFIGSVASWDVLSWNFFVVVFAELHEWIKEASKFLVARRQG